MPDDQNNAPATGGVTGKGFMPGQSGNPGGRPKGLARRIREQTQDGAEIVDFMLAMFRDPAASARDRREAAEWLTDHGFGKATQSLELTGDGGGPLVFQRTIVKPQDYEPTS